MRYCDEHECIARRADFREDCPWCEIERLRSQLPSEMQNCTIVFKECDVGHGRLVATNWLDPGCLKCEIERLRAELARERMRLAACGVVAMANTPDSAKQQRQMHDDYRSDSLDEVAKAVDREMALRAELTAHYEKLSTDDMYYIRKWRQAEAERDALQYEALGFAYAWACNLLDRGLDPRKVEVPELTAQWEGRDAAIDAARKSTSAPPQSP